MSEQPSASGEASWLKVAVLASDADAAHAFVQAVLERAEPCAAGRAAVQGYPVELQAVAAEPEPEASWVAQLDTLDAAVLVARHLDSASIDALRRRYRRLTDGRDIPLGVFLFRDPGQHEFKISCWECGQKLLVDDRHIGKRGRCVHCGRSFRVSTPSEYLRSLMGLPDTVPILVVFRGQTPSCHGALLNVLARAAPEQTTPRATGRDFLHQATVPINVDPDQDGSAK